MTEQVYLLAWGLYAIAALGCLLVWFRMTGWIWRWGWPNWRCWVG